MTQLEAVPLLGQKNKNRYEKLGQEDVLPDEDTVVGEKQVKKKWWGDGRSKNEEKIDNKKNELVEKQMEMKTNNKKHATNKNENKTKEHSF